MIFRKNDQEVEITLSNRTIVRGLVLVSGGIIAFIAIKHSLGVLTLIATAMFLALALNEPVRWLATRLPKGKKKDRRALATLISIFVIVAALIGFMVAVVPPLVRQTVSFVKTAPSIVADAKNENTPIGSFVRQYNLEEQVDNIADQLGDRVGQISSSAISTVAKVGSSLFSIVVVMVLTVMMLFEGPRWGNLAYTLLPAKRRPHAKKLTHEMLRVIQGYVNGQVLLASIAALLIVPVFFIMDVSYPIALMVIVFICGLIPMVGHTIGAAICTVVALFTSLPAALVVLGYYILYQQIENYTVQPKIQASNTNLSPLLVLISALIGGTFGGLLGALVAIPVAGCIRVVLVDYLERRDLLKPESKKELPTTSAKAKTA